MADEIICLGDSITGWNNFYGPEREERNAQAYPAFLEEILKKAGIINPVINAGFDGAKSDEFPDLFWGYEAMHPKSKYFVVQFGTNDFYNSGFSDQTSRLILSYMSAVVKRIKSSGKIPIVLNNYRMDYGQKEMEQIIKHNQDLAAECRGQSAACIDLYSKLASEHLSDGIHPNELGSRIIAEEAAKVIIQMEKQKEFKQFNRKT